MRKTKTNMGFTLIELLITIVILGLLVSIVAPEMFSKVGSSKRKAAEAQMQMLETAISAYRLDTGRLPEALAELRRSEVNNWDGPYLPKDVPLDPWGNSYSYETTNDKLKPFILKSLAADGAEGGEDEDEDIILQ
ncbi:MULTISPECIES: type II secretion system major pseudopilin GspG [Pseudoalteromonas]|uniref:type II secretion system major pseudopilin GspG n=1 Tax=Pseudoalteromonas TaxID=53246 RepID=UPI0015825365|nr:MULTISPECIES: type II secretion system major pseudopilin GspG [Pseudoalteromonas]MDI4652087.1 type II secretion system major pseudopilin GspG [Pseudoalteromonas shioyasakiensis]NUJ38412.1 type II secretion system major pseudopilin GspG [Pseudoalteromonas sp. 0303]